MTQAQTYIYGQDDDWDPEPFEGSDDLANFTPVGRGLWPDLPKSLDDDDVFASNDDEEPPYEGWPYFPPSDGTFEVGDDAEVGWGAPEEEEEEVGWGTPAVTVVQPSTTPMRSYLARIAPSSAATQEGALRTIARILGGPEADPYDIAWEALTYAETSQVRNVLASRYRPATSRRCVSALKGVLTEAKRLHLMSRDDYDDATDLSNIRGNSKRKGHFVPPEDMRKLLDACDDDTIAARGIRDSAIIALAYGGALRRAEVTSLDVEDFDEETGELNVLGKGDKTRTVTLSPRATTRVRRWIEVRGRAPGALIGKVAPCGRPRVGQMSGEGVSERLRIRSEEAGIRRVNVHDLRRTAASEMFNFADPFTVSGVLGHADIKTTMLYDYRPVDMQRHASRGIGGSLNKVIGDFDES